MKEREELEEALNRAEAAEADAAYQRRHRKWALRRVRRWFYWRKRADDMGDAWLTQKSRAEAAEADLTKMTANAEIERLDKERAMTERDKLAERVRVLEEALGRLVDAADAYAADQAGATPLCGWVQPISKAEGDELNAALGQARAALDPKEEKK